MASDANLSSNGGRHYHADNNLAVAASAFFRRFVAAVIFLVAVCCSCFVLYRAAESVGFQIPAPYYYHYSRFSHTLPEVSPDDFPPVDSEEYKLERVLNDASMPDKTVILTTLSEAWAGPNSVIDLFLESFRIGEHTRRLLNHLVIVALDQKAFSRCRLAHTHCFPLINEAVNSSGEAYFMTPEYLKMMWNRIHFLTSILEMGFNFVFTDADIMWFRDPFRHFYLDADFQIACDHFTGRSDDVENLPNGGFKFVRANNRSIKFYKYWYTSKEVYPGLHDQDVLNKIKNDTFVHEIGLKMLFLNTEYFGGFCEPSADLNQVCTMHANCCFGLSSKLHDLRILIQDWKEYMSLPPGVKASSLLTWSVPQNCSLDALQRQDAYKEDLHTEHKDEQIE